MSTEVEFDKINADESWQVFDATAQRVLGLTGEAFVERWDSGVYAQDDDIRVMQVVMLRPSGR